MSKGKFERKKQRYIWPYFVAGLVVLVLVVILVWPGGTTTLSTPEPTEPMPTVEKNPDSIAIPGYEMLELKAGSKEQSLCLPNPPQNCCYFQISLYLKDGTLLWQSDLIEPGMNSKPIVLSKALTKGTYSEVVLRYSCYRMDDALSPLNGAETKVTLWVK